MTHASSKSQAVSAPRTSFAVLLVTQVCFGMSFSTFFLLPKYLTEALSASELEIGVVGASGALAGVIAFPLVGTLNDRFGRARFVLLGNGLMTVSALLMLPLDRAGLGMTGLRMLQGLAFALSFNSTTTLATDRVDSRDFGRVLAVFGTALLVTNALAPAVAEVLAETVSWQLSFQVAAGFGAASVVSALLIRESAHTRSLPGSVRNPWSMLRRPRTAVATLGVVAAGAGFGTALTYYQPYALALGMKHLSGFFVAYALAALVVRLLAITRLERAGRQTLSAASLLLYAVAVGSIAFLTPTLLIPIGALMGLAHGVFYPVCNAFAIEAVEPRERGLVMSLYHGGFNGGVALAVLGGGVLVSGLGYSTLFLTTGGLVAVSALVLWRARLRS